MFFIKILLVIKQKIIFLLFDIKNIGVGPTFTLTACLIALIG